MEGRRFIWLLCGFTFLFFLGQVQAQDKFPSRPIELVIPYTPGGQSDTISRIFTPKLSQALKVPITLVNRGGAGGLQGVSYTARAKKDGYTLLTGAQGPIVVMPLISAESTVDPLKDLLPLAYFGSAPSIFVVKSDSPFKTFNDLVEYARKNPGKLKNAAPGLANSGQFNLNLLCAKNNINITTIPFKGGGDSLVALLGGHTDMTVSGTGSLGAQVKAGNLRALAITSKKRSSHFPDVPTTAELGHPYLSIVGWVGLFAPAGTPQAVRNVLLPAMQKAFNDPTVIERANAGYFTVDYMGPEEFRKFLVAEIRVVEKIVKDAGLKEK